MTTLEEVLTELKATRTELVALRASNDRMERTLRTKIDTPVNMLSTAKAAQQLGMSVKGFEKVVACGVFTDNRSSEERRRKCHRAFYSDEIEAYKTGRAEGVARLREELDRE